MNRSKKTVELIVEVGWYAYENSLLVEPEDSFWFSAQMETVAHLVSCCVVQWLGQDSLATSECLQLLRIEDVNNKLLTQEQFRTRINEMLAELEIEVE